jgi:hypothetical protein
MEESATAREKRLYSLGAVVERKCFACDKAADVRDDCGWF